MRDFIVTYRVPAITMGIIIATVALDSRRPSHDLDFQTLGTQALSADQPHEAAEFFSKALRLNPADAGARAGLAASYSAIGLSEEAVKQYEMSVLKSADLLKRSLLNLESLSEKLGHKDEAKRYHRSALAVDQMSR